MEHMKHAYVHISFRRLTMNVVLFIYLFNAVFHSSDCTLYFRLPTLGVINE
jgi:hypothetical protein